ncbi:acyl-CoA synthetase [Sutcliffiella sp. NC1]|uniref:acyl-CoA synthetase n=1 Tax=Sutcliffiella sp. NC1 TaxID=3004096 RepID=UPI0022DDAAF9|nr:long-chain fatty acid--CoA ligase [Sutcliffiella sp. NC1]WBL16184.1 long-chain fatty acid--CoA ligase [Sutcliffiella sp. NC1]
MSNECLWLKKRSQLTPEHIAVIDANSGERWTYKQLYRRSLSYSKLLQAKGIKKGDRVALLSQNDICYLDLLFACANIGAIFVPLNIRLSVNELSYILSDSGVSCLFFNKIEVDEQILKNYQCFNIEDITFTDTFSVMKTELSKNDPLAIIYTGGTTGKPKGVVLSFQSIETNALNTIISWDLSSKDVTLTCIPLFHTGGLNALTLPHLYIGGTVVIMEQFDAESVIHVLNQYSCTNILMVPTMYYSMIQQPSFQTNEFKSVHTFLSGGAPCPLTIYEEFQKKGLLFKQGYGLTEAGPNNFFIEPQDVYKKIGSVGKPMFYNDVKIMNEKEQELGVNEVGELWIRGNHLFLQYWNNELETNKAKHGKWLKTGDLAKRDEEGYYYIVGRKKEMIITGGENVYPTEVEQSILKVDAVKEVVVFGIPHPKWGEAVVACVTLRDRVSDGEMTTLCKQLLASYKVPKQFFILDTIPVTPVGKIDKKALYNKYSEYYIKEDITTNS